MKKIFTLNVNGIRSGIQKGFIEYLESVQADIICLQEIKANEDQIPIFEINTLGYHSFWFPAVKKGYSGTAILTKTEPDKVIKGMGISKYDNEGRFIRIDIDDISYISVYHPSGSSGDERQKFKMEWLDDFYNYIHELKKERPKLIISGDYNICHKPIDIHDPVRNKNSSGFLPEEREWMDKFFDSGFVDTFREINTEPHQYSWWSYRANARAKNLGWRIDYNVVSENLREKIVDAHIEPTVMLSDHCPVFLVIDN